MFILLLKHNFKTNSNNSVMLISVSRVFKFHGNKHYNIFVHFFISFISQ